MLPYSRSNDRAKRLVNTRKEIRRTEVSLVIYRSLQYLNQEFNICFSIIILPWLLLLVVLLPATSGCFLIRLHSKLHVLIKMAVPVLSVACVIVVLVAFPVAASVNSLSSSYLESLKTEANENQSQWKPYTKFYIRSCRTLRAQCHSQFYIRKFTVLKLIGLMILWSVRYMLLYQLK